MNIDKAIHIVSLFCCKINISPSYITHTLDAKKLYHFKNAWFLVEILFDILLS